MKKFHWKKVRAQIGFIQIYISNPIIYIFSDLSLLIDAKALFSLLGSQMDYTDDKLSQGFLFRNPNVGSSFSFVIQFELNV